MIGILIITHNQVGQAILDAAVSVFGKCPMPTKVLMVSQASDPDERLQKAQSLKNELNDGDGVLIITDMYGSTPSNIATRLSGEHTVVLAGLNLPMLVRIMNYPQLPLTELADKAISGGRDGVVSCFPGESCT